MSDAEDAAGGTLLDSLRRTLADPSLDVVYPQVGTDTWVDSIGRPAREVAGRVRTPVLHDGRPVAALVHDADLLGHPERLRLATDAVAAAIDNERIKAELRAQLLDSQASRARIVEVADAERHRIERNLHDGAQQRLVGLALTLRLLRRQAEQSPALTELLADAAHELEDALGELRRLARGLHPAIVVDAGLRAALEALAERPGLPVDLHLDLPDVLPDHAAVAAYYVVAEALVNTNKHARATTVSAHAAPADGALLVTVADDGRGGAEATPGSGLQGLADRISALGGTFVIDSPVGAGTTISAEIPLHVAQDLDRGLRSRVALKWIGWENWEAPAVLYDQITDDDLLTGGKAILLGAGGNGAITPAERHWLAGYLTAAGESERVLEAIRTYDDADQLADLIALPNMTDTPRGLLYDSIRVCAADGPITAAELDRLTHGADVMGVPRDVLAELVEIVGAEHSLRRRRYRLITEPLLYGGTQP